MSFSSTSIDRINAIIAKHAPKLLADESPGAGRGLFAAQASAEGELIMTCEPFAYIIDSKSASTRCHRCLAKPRKLFVCTKCKKTRYCGSDCQKNDWTWHKYECKAMATAPRRFPESVALVIRIVTTLFVNKEYLVESDLSLLTKSVQPNDDQGIQSVAGLAEVYLHKMGPVSAWVTPDDLMHLVYLVTTNAFSMCDAELQGIAVGVYLPSSLLNHRCQPNAVATFVGTKMLLRPLTDIKQGDEVTISYIDVINPRRVRRQDLKNKYKFYCTCSACSDDELDLKMAGMVCENRPSCDGFVPDDADDKGCLSERVCSKGCIQSTASVDREARLNISIDGNSQSVQSLSKRLQGMAELYSPVNARLATTANQAMDVAIDTYDWPKAVEFGELALPCMKLMYSSCHPLLGLQLMKLGKILLLEEKVCKRCVIRLQEACGILQVAYGDNHFLVNECYSLIHQAEAELAATESAEAHETDDEMA